MNSDIHKTGIGMIPIADIVVGDRFREEIDDIDDMMFSIENYGQLEPIIVTDEGNSKYRLVAGGQRIRAFKKLDRTEIEARLFSNLDELSQVELELEFDVRRKNLKWAELARAAARITELKKLAYQKSMPNRFGRGLSQKQIAKELNMTESVLSEHLTVAKGLEEHPAIEFAIDSRKQALKIIRNKSFETMPAGTKNRIIDESYLVADAFAMLDQISVDTADLIILDPDKLDEKLMRASFQKLKAGGSLIIFSELLSIPTWINHAEALGLYSVAPSIWHIKSVDVYVPFIWFGKHRERPLRLMPPHISCPRSKTAQHKKAKPYNLMLKIIKSSTEMGGFVVVPECYDVETIKCCIDAERNIRAACPDKMFRDKLVLNT